MLAIDLAKMILLLAAWVVLPLGLRLIPNEACRSKRIAMAIWAPAAVMLTAAFLLAPGTWAAACALPWLVFTLMLATWGASRLWQTSLKIDSQLCFHAALIFIAVGGMWTFVSLGGWNLTSLGFSDEIILLTGVHFHYAGFALPLLSGLAVESYQGRKTVFITVVTRYMILGVIFGVPLVGVGITYSPLVEIFAALFLASACFLLVGLQGGLALRAKNASVLMLFAVSSVSLIGGMGLGCVYAVGQYCETVWIDIPTMILLHGLANSIGFVLFGLIAWLLKET